MSDVSAQEWGVGIFKKDELTYTMRGSGWQRIYWKNQVSEERSTFRWKIGMENVTWTKFVNSKTKE